MKNSTSPLDREHHSRKNYQKYLRILMLSLQGQTYIPPSSEPVSRMVIFLHGYGASGDNLLGISHYWQEILPGTTRLQLRKDTFLLF